MKVKCFKQDIFDKLTIGKTYDVIKIDDDGNYYIIDDIGYELRYLKEHFKSLSEIRNEKINKLLEDENSLYK